MSRVVLGIEYDGTNYYGWQAQKNNHLSTIQYTLEQAISVVANHPVSTVCAGRTDAKVHAMAQIVHFDSDANRKIDAWMLGVNRYLPLDIRVIFSTNTDPNFNARKSAIYRTYYYFIYNSRIRPALLKDRVTWQYNNLDIELMQKASNFWLGEHDFTSFRGKDCQSKTAFRNIYNIIISQKQELIKITITANAFLQHMIRNMVGVLMEIGQQKYSPSWAKEVLLAKNRQSASITAPPEGLYLAEVGYPKQYRLPKLTRGFNIL